MGARVNFVFIANKEQPYLVLYSHWGETSWRQDLALALDKARPRWTDDSYCLRIIIDQLMKEGRDSETGFGIFLANRDELPFLDSPVIIDTQAMWVEDGGTEHSWNSFCEYHLEEIPSNHELSAT